MAKKYHCSLCGEIIPYATMWGDDHCANCQDILTPRPPEMPNEDGGE